MDTQVAKDGSPRRLLIAHSSLHLTTAAFSFGPACSATCGSIFCAFCHLAHDILSSQPHMAKPHALKVYHARHTSVPPSAESVAQYIESSYQLIACTMLHCSSSWVLWVVVCAGQWNGVVWVWCVQCTQLHGSILSNTHFGVNTNTAEQDIPNGAHHDQQRRW